MRFRHLCLLIAGLVLFVGITSARANVLIEIDKTKQRMTVTVDDTLRYIWRVSTGAASYDTPNGEFTPFRMEKDHFSREWDDAPMPNSIFFTKIGHAIHGTFEGRHLGRPVSHGCVRLSRANAETLFELVKEKGLNNTRVVLNGSIPGSDKTPAVARHKPNVNSPDHDNRRSARVRQRLHDNDRLYAPNYSAGDDFRGYYTYREPPRRVYSGGMPVPYPFVFGQ
jgi:hypothetical protein